MAAVRFHGRQGKLDAQPSPAAGLALEGSTQGLDPLTHTPQAVAFILRSPAPVILNFEQAPAVPRSQAQRAVVRLGMAHYIGDGFPYNQRHHAFLGGG